MEGMPEAFIGSEDREECPDFGSLAAAVRSSHDADEVDATEDVPRQRQHMQQPQRPRKLGSAQEKRRGPRGLGFGSLARFAHQIGSAVCSEGGSARRATEASGAGAIAPVSTLTEIAKRSIATGDRPT